MRVNEDSISEILSQRIRSSGTEQEVLKDVFALTDQLITDKITAIGIGVPSVVDVEEGIVYDVVWIPSWKEVPLKKWMEARYQVPVYVNNDANCFALGEHYFGKGRGYNFHRGLTRGTGVGGGVIINNKYTRAAIAALENSVVSIIWITCMNIIAVVLFLKMYTDWMEKRFSKRQRETIHPHCSCTGNWNAFGKCHKNGNVYL